MYVFSPQVVFEALHSLEPRGYVVGWIIAISLLVGILIFLLLAVLLWKVSVPCSPASPGLQLLRGKLLCCCRPRQGRDSWLLCSTGCS